MTDSLRALKVVANHVVLSAAVLGAVLLLVSADLTGFLVPPPDQVASQALRALKAHREPAARNGLAAELRKQVPVEELRRLADEIDRRRGGISNVSGETVAEQGDRATARVTVRLADGGEEQLELPLVREQRLWRLASIEPIRGLVDR